MAGSLTELRHEAPETLSIETFTNTAERAGVSRHNDDNHITADRVAPVHGPPRFSTTLAPDRTPPSWGRGA